MPDPSMSALLTYGRPPPTFARQVERLYREFGRLLRAARERTESKLTQNELARMVGLSRTSITNIESGKQQISLQTLFVLAKAVGVHPNQLLPDTSYASADGDSLLSKIDQLQFSKTTKALLQKSVSSDKPPTQTDS